MANAEDGYGNAYMLADSKKHINTFYAIDLFQWHKVVYRMFIEADKAIRGEIFENRPKE